MVIHDLSHFNSMIKIGGTATQKEDGESPLAISGRFSSKPWIADDTKEANPRAVFHQSKGHFCFRALPIISSKM
jgi:hypothetical protein